jgi:5-methyltetrahydrofolate--homocysteine methyltransferase
VAVTVDIRYGDNACGLGKIKTDRVKDYARRKSWTLAEAERWLAPILNYNPRAVAAA